MLGTADRHWQAGYTWGKSLDDVSGIIENRIHRRRDVV